jgi:drug/metabolite transporter (DMT)-like permease
MAQTTELPAMRANTDARRFHHRKAILLLILACLFWGISFPTGKALTQLYLQSINEASSWFVVSLQGAIRFLLAGLLMVPFGWRELRTLDSQELLQGFGLGLFGGAGMLLQMDGLAYTSASVSAFLTQAYCILLPIYHFSRTRRLPAFRDFLAIFMVITGIAILANVDWKTFKIGRGELETLVSAVFFTFQILWLERPAFRRNRTRVVSTTMFLSMGLIFAVAAFCTHPNGFNCAEALNSFPKVFLTLLLVFFCTLLAFNLMNHCQPAISSTEAGIVYTTEPLFASLFALFLPAQFSALTNIDYANEQFSLTLLTGGGLILLANLILQIRSGKAIPPVAEVRTTTEISPESPPGIQKPIS